LVVRQMAEQDRETTVAEDITLVESVQRGLRSLGYNQGRFIVDQDLTELSEHAVHHFQAMVAEALGVEPEA
ncbi:MAG: SRPBCC family protein, partial [Pseudomonadota bacterium]